ncbi:MAG: branched-chain amino acid transport system II carrier protein [Actinomycetaceae bacterium]|nr:branched-chain amino acid transport system II carrier protein [Actinomycetaceae bacterium]
MRKSRTYVLLITGLALFAMFFGAGNLIFPVMIGVNAGTSITPAILGFLGTGVLLPILAIIAAATAQEGVTGIASRIGKYPGLVFTIVIFLSTGMLYAIPRVATVSYEMAVVPLLDSGNPNGWPLFLYTVVFFAVTFLLALNPKGFLDRIGGWLTPALLLLLIVLITAAVVRMPAALGEPAKEYTQTPFATGLLQGYFTMDAIASLVFGIVIISSLRHRGFNTKSQVFTGTAIAGLIAGVALALIYIGLTLIGTRVGVFGVTNGAEALARAATELFGTGGQALFGLIALLACLTTAVGLTGASSEYFRTLFPRISRPKMVAIHALVSLALANLGLEVILDVVAPVNQLIYPVVICVVFIALFDIFVPGQLYWTYRLSAWLGAFFGLFEALWSTKLPQFAMLRDWLDMLPLGSVNMPWVVPALVGFVIGLILDTVQGDDIWKRRATEIEGAEAAA